MSQLKTLGIVGLLCALLMVVFGMQVLAGQEGPGAAKIAVVNGVAIERADLDNEMRRIEQQVAMTGQAIPPEKLGELKKRVLEGLIDRELLYQQSEKSGIKVEESEVNEQIAELKNRFSSEDEFKEVLKKMDVTESELKSQFGREIIIKKYVDREIAPKAQVKDEEVQTFYRAHPEYFKTPEMVRASHILVKVDPKATEVEKAKAREKIMGIQKRLQKSEDFAKLAEEYSDCPSSAKGGDLNFFKRGQMVGPFEDAAFALKAGETSDIVETQFGYHLIKVTERKDAGEVPYEEIKGKIEEHLKKASIEKQLSEQLEQWKKSAKIERLAMADEPVQGKQDKKE